MRQRIQSAARDRPAAKEPWETWLVGNDVLFAGLFIKFHLKTSATEVSPIHPVQHLDPCQHFLHSLGHPSRSFAWFAECRVGHKHAPECFQKMVLHVTSTSLATAPSGDRVNLGYNVLGPCRFLQISFARGSLCPMQLQICMVAHQRKLLDENFATNSHEFPRRMCVCVCPDRSSY